MIIFCEFLNCMDYCKCMYIVKLEKDKIVQIVFLNMGKKKLMIYYVKCFVIFNILFDDMN